MGNAPTKTLQKRGKKYVHWSNADRPGPPGKPLLVPGTPLNQPDVVHIKWEPPTDDGGAPITGYLVEHRRMGSPHWVRATPSLVHCIELTLSGLEPGWRYQFRVSAENAAGMSDPGELSEPLTVTLQRSAAAAPHFVQELKETVVLENDTAEFSVHFRGTPTPKIAWFKDGFEIFSSRRTKIVTENDVSTLVIFQAAFNDEGEVKCTATNRVGHIVTKAKLRLEAPPRIRLPRQYEDGLLFEMDEIIRLKVSVAGRPLPRVTWLHNGEPIVFGGRHEITNTDKASSMRVGEARRADRGEYQVRASSRLGEDVVSFLVTVTDRPLPPSKAKVVMTLGKSVTLSWVKPNDDGGCKIGNYIVEYYRVGWNVWLKAATCRQLTTTLGDLIEGSEYKFRVKAENPYGVSDPSDESEVVFIPDPKRGLLEAPAKGSKVAEQPPPPPEAVKDERKKRPIPSPDPSRFKREKHSDSSMEYPSSDADSDAQRKSDLPKRTRDADSASPLIPIPVLEFNTVKEDASPKRKVSDNKPAEGASLTPESKRIKGKDNDFRPGGQLKTEVPAKSMQVSPKSLKRPQIEQEVKPAPAGKRREEEEADLKDADYNGLSAEVYSLKIPVGKGAKLEESGPTKVTVAREGDRPEPIPREHDRLELIPREDDESLMHGSSEMMLVLLPHTRDDPSQTDRGRSGSFPRSMDEINSLGVAPPMSLSAPELGGADSYELPPLRNAISSTELLHEKTMARFYLEAEAEEMERSLARRRRSGDHSADRRRDSLKARDKPRPAQVQEDAAEQAELQWHKKKQRDTNGFDAKAPGPVNLFKAATTQLTEEEQEEADFQRLRERIAKSLEEDYKAVEDEMRYMKKDLQVQKEDVEDEEHEDPDLVEEELEEEEEEMEEEEESIPSEGELEADDEPDEESETYNPREKFRTQEIARKTAPLRSMEPSGFSDDEEESYHPRGLVRMVQEAPPPVPTHREVLTIRTINESSTSPSPVRFEPKLDLQPKPILKTSSKFETEQEKDKAKDKDKDNDKDKKKSKNERADTPFSAKEKKEKQPILNKILGKIELPFKKLKSSEEDSTGIGFLKRKKKDSKKDKKDKPSDEDTKTKKDELAATEGKGRKDSLYDDTEISKTVVSYYSDLVKEYGSGVKKTSPNIFLNTAQLKAAAESSIEDSDISVSPEPLSETKQESQSPTLKDSSKALLKPPAPPKPVASPQPPTPSPPLKKTQNQKSISPEYSDEDLSLDEEEMEDEELGEEEEDEEEEEEEEEEVEVEEEEKEEVEEEVPWEFSARHMMARIRRSLTPKRSFRQNKRPPRALTAEQAVKEAETRVHHFINYLTDLAMFLVACWLYLFKDERLAIPVLLLMVYRQMHEAVMRWVPKRWRRQEES